jgi:hypothetical protein
MGPLAWERLHAGMGDLEDYSRPILLLGKPPGEEWALAQDPEDPAGVPAGRVVTDIVRDGKCCECMNLEVTAEHQLVISQKNKFKYNGQLKPNIQPVEYKPQDGLSPHALLWPGNFYSLWDLQNFSDLKPGENAVPPYVSAKDIWLPRVPIPGHKKPGCTLAQWQMALAEVLNGPEPEDLEQEVQDEMQQQHLDQTMQQQLNQDMQEHMILNWATHDFSQGPGGA